MRPVDTINACRASHMSLLADLAPLADDDFRTPSLLPRYSRGHVVTHLANKARAHVHIFGGPAAGEIRQVHPDGYNPDLAADRGVNRSAAELRSDLTQSFELLEGTWDAFDDTLWDRQGIMAAGRRTMAEIVAHHLRNVEVHHVDLDVGHRPSDWPSILVDGELPKRLRSLPDRAGHAEILAWLLGRAPAPNLDGPW
ncbi:maleylpyruvate isomerase N-terminal domain-containing protein [Kribbella sp. NBC_00482]|uniref:maleylpyruvate isomerase N-terminal domain-containing protein n=1 Tax=Kribbella sp. NBC_00482 TaxID=2975968 RepID=UPI002E182B28